jgi:hypothetical protein
MVCKNKSEQNFRQVKVSFFAEKIGKMSQNPTFAENLHDRGRCDCLPDAGMA